MSFNYENKFFRGLSKLVDMFILSFLWVLSSLPIFTIGASSTALYYCVHKALVRGRGYIWNTYWEAFRDNFKQSTVMWLLQLFIYLVLSADIYITWNFMKEGNPFGYMLYPFLMLFLLVMAWSMLIFSYTARFNNTNKAILKNAILIGILNLPKVIVLLLCMGVGILMIYLIWPMIFLIPALHYWIMDSILEKVFRKYMTPEEKAQEEEIDKIAKEN